MDMHPPSDDELNDLPHVVLTSDIDWDPSIVDNEMDLEQWLDAQMEHDDLPGINDYGDLTFDDQGYYLDVTVNNVNFYDAYQSISEFCELEDIVDHVEYKYRVNPHEVSHNDPDFEALRPYFAWSSRKHLMSLRIGHEALNIFLSESTSSHVSQLLMCTIEMRLLLQILSIPILMR